MLTVAFDAKALPVNIVDEPAEYWQHSLLKACCNSCILESVCNADVELTLQSLGPCADSDHAHSVMCFPVELLKALLRSDDCVIDGLMATLMKSVPWIARRCLWEM